MIDAQNEFSRDQSLIAGAGNVLATNSFDCKAAGTDFLGNSLSAFKDKGRGRLMQIVAQLTATVTSGGAATLQVQVIDGTGVDGAGQINAGLRILYQTDAIALATLVQGYQFKLGAIPIGTTQRYISLRFVIGTAAITAGTICAFLANEVQFQ